MQDRGYGLRRIPLLGSRVNKGKKKGRDPYSRTPASLYTTPRSGKGGLTTSAIKGCYFGLITPQVAGMVAS
jgi:hypothetical protein